MSGIWRQKAKLCRKIFFVSAVLLAVSTLAPAAGAAAAAQGTKSWSITWQPARLVNGSPVMLRVAPLARLDSLRGSFLAHQIYFSFDPKSRTWYAIAGVSLETKAGSYTLQLTGATKAGKEVSFQRVLAVRRATYPSVSVTVSKRFTEPNPEQLQKIHQDKVIKDDVFRRVSPEREWSGDFVAPAEARISDVFGTRRVFNGKVQSTHQGLDYAVPAGTPVTAVNSGTVLLAGPLYFEGNCVVLDHGQGLLTLYLHLSEFKVKEGDHVARGQRIGLSGGTGRATGPHLHVAVRWQGVYLNPATLLTLRLP